MALRLVRRKLAPIDACLASSASALREETMLGLGLMEMLIVCVMCAGPLILTGVAVLIFTRKQK